MSLRTTTSSPLMHHLDRRGFGEDRSGWSRSCVDIPARRRSSTRFARDGWRLLSPITPPVTTPGPKGNLPPRGGPGLLSCWPGRRGLQGEDGEPRVPAFRVDSVAGQGGGALIVKNRVPGTMRPPTGPASASRRGAPPRRAAGAGGARSTTAWIYPARSASSAATAKRETGTAPRGEWPGEVAPEDSWPGGPFREALSAMQQMPPVETPPGTCAAGSGGGEARARASPSSPPRETAGATRGPGARGDERGSAAGGGAAPVAARRRGRSHWEADGPRPDRGRYHGSIGAPSPWGRARAALAELDGAPGARSTAAFHLGPRWW